MTTIEKRKSLECIDRCVIYDLLWPHYQHVGLPDFLVVQKAIKSIPDSDVRPVVRGKWLHKEITADFHVVGQCSVCKERRRIDNFCPNCGADMREANDGI